MAMVKKYGLAKASKKVTILKRNDRRERQAFQIANNKILSGIAREIRIQENAEEKRKVKETWLGGLKKYIALAPERKKARKEKKRKT